VEGFCEHDIESLISVKGGEFLEHVSEYLLHRRNLLGAVIIQYSLFAGPDSGL
jgi:hypothetical protein